MRIFVIAVILGLCAVGYSRPSKSKLSVFLCCKSSAKRYNTEQTNTPFYKQGVLVL